MELVNPFGIKASSAERAGDKIMACKCSNYYNNFSSYRTSSDNCSHCGCGCHGNYSSNDSAARSASRSSRA